MFCCSWMRVWCVVYIRLCCYIEDLIVVHTFSFTSSPFPHCSSVRSSRQVQDRQRELRTVAEGEGLDHTPEGWHMSSVRWVHVFRHFFFFNFAKPSDDFLVVRSCVVAVCLSSLAGHLLVQCFSKFFFKDNSFLTFLQIRDNKHSHKQLYRHMLVINSQNRLPAYDEIFFHDDMYCVLCLI
jgi:hypothetical protein